MITFQNMSLDSFRFNVNFALDWDKRFNILKGVAAGLLYLHEEWEQVVIHRDVKSSNILIDGEFNARLGDFGLARLYSHDQVLDTTSVVGTIGYIVRQVTSDILRRGVELRYYKLFPQLKFYFEFNASSKFP